MASLLHPRSYVRGRLARRSRRKAHKDGVTFKARQPPDWDFWSDFEQGWEADILETVANYSAGLTLVDVGAWIGPVSMWAAARGARRVVAVEPDPVALPILRENIRRNHLPIEVAAGVIAATPGDAGIAPREGRGGFGLSLTHLDPESSTRVPAWTLPELFDEFAVEDCGLVKIDIEGGEAEILEDVAPWCAARSIPLLVSLHEPWFTRDVSIPEVRTWFADFAEVRGEWEPFGSVLALPRGTTG